MHLNAVGGDCPGKTELHAGYPAHAAMRASWSSSSRKRASRARFSSSTAAARVIELADVVSGKAPARLEPTRGVDLRFGGIRAQRLLLAALLAALERELGGRERHRPHPEPRRSEGSVRRAQARRVRRDAQAASARRERGMSAYWREGEPHRRADRRRRERSRRLDGSGGAARRGSASRRCTARGLDVRGLRQRERAAESGLRRGRRLSAIWREVAAWNREVHGAVYRELGAERLPILLGGDHSLSHRLDLGRGAPLPRDGPAAARAVARCACRLQYART